MCSWSITISDFGIAKMMLLKYEAYGGDFDKPGCGIEKLVNNVADVIYGMLSLAYLFLLHLLG